MKIDLHTHTKERSGCSTLSEDELIQTAIARGLDAIAIADHKRLVPRERLEELNRKYAPFRIFGAIEVQCNNEHIVVLGVHDPVLEKGTCTYAEIHEMVKNRDGYLILAHPYRSSSAVSVDVDGYPPDAMEIHTSGLPLAAAQRIRELAGRLGATLLSDSDGHAVEPIGHFYNELDADPKTDAELVAALRNARVKPFRSPTAPLPPAPAA